MFFCREVELECQLLLKSCNPTCSAVSQDAKLSLGRNPDNRAGVGGQQHTLMGFRLLTHTDVIDVTSITLTLRLGPVFAGLMSVFFWFVDVNVRATKHVWEQVRLIPSVRITRGWRFAVVVCYWFILFVRHFPGKTSSIPSVRDIRGEGSMPPHLWLNIVRWIPVSCIYKDTEV